MAHLAKKFAQITGTRGDYNRVIMEKFVVHFRLQHYIGRNAYGAAESSSAEEPVTMKALEPALGNKDKLNLLDDVTKQLVSPFDAVTRIYLLNSDVSRVYFAARQSASSSSNLEVFQLDVSSNEAPRGVKKTDISVTELQKHDVTSTCFFFSRAIIFRNKIYGERWEYGTVKVNPSLRGVVGTRTSSRRSR